MCGRTELRMKPPHRAVRYEVNMKLRRPGRRNVVIRLVDVDFGKVASELIQPPSVRVESLFRAESFAVHDALRQLQARLGFAHLTTPINVADTELNHGPRHAIPAVA